MTHFPQPQSSQRAPRVKLDGSVLVAIRVEGTDSVRAKLRELSATGGLLMLANPLEAGEFVELAFQTTKGAVQGMAEVLEPQAKARSGCLQPFRFIALEDEAHSNLSRVLESLLDQITVGSGLRVNAVLGLR
jgi:hypothetical protein